MGVYGSIAAVKQALQPTTSTDWTADQEATLVRIQKAVSLAIEEETGRTFGTPGPATTRLFYAGADGTVILPVPARSVTTVVVGGDVAGGVVTGGTPYAATAYALDPVDRHGNVLGLRLLSGTTWGYGAADGTAWTPVQVTGIFADADEDADVPDDLTDTANFLIAETFKYRGASPAGFVGPDGSVVPIRNPWTDPLVVRTLKKYGLRKQVVGF